MLNLQKYNEERDEIIEKDKTIKQFLLYDRNMYIDYNFIKNLSHQSHKDLYLTIAEYEYKRLTDELNSHKDNHICRFNDGEQNCDCYLQGIEKQITHWQSIINELTKEKI